MSRVKTEKGFKVLATVILKDVDKMTPGGRRKIAEWLRLHARHVLKHGHNYAPRLTGRYFARESSMGDWKV